MFLPLAFVALGVWERARIAPELVSLQSQQEQLAEVVAALEARPPAPAGRIDMGMRFQHAGKTYVGALALAEARRAQGELDNSLMLARFRQYLPPVVIAGGLALATLSLLMLALGFVLGLLGRSSRDRLIGCFSLARRVLPSLLGAQVVLGAGVFIAAVAFEAAGLLDLGSSSGRALQLFGVAVVVVGFSVWTAIQAILQLRRAVDLFTPEPLPIIGRTVSAAEAPGLWRLVDGLAERLGALRPDHVVVGLSEGFFVTAGPQLLIPGDAPLSGRTLYLPLPYLALMRGDEIATIIGHELAHFSGGDLDYSQRFAPIYAGVGRSLDAVASAGQGRDGSVSPLVRPALQLGVFVMEQFHHAVRHWSRVREFEADAASITVTSPDAAARALLRSAAAAPRIAEVLDPAFAEPAAAPPDLVAAIQRHAAERGFDDPAAFLEERQPHPTDTHPPTRQRLAAFGGETPELLAEAAIAPPVDALSRLGYYLAEPDALCRDATVRFLDAARQAADAERADLEATASSVAKDAVSLHENTRPVAIVLCVTAAVVLGGVLALVTLGVQGLRGQELWIVGGTGLVAGLFCLASAWSVLRRGRTPFLVLTPEAMRHRHLQPIAWSDIAALDIRSDTVNLITLIALEPEAPLPARSGAWWRVKVDRKQRVVVFKAAPPRELKMQGYIDLMHRYHHADQARRLLAGAAPPA